MKTANLLIFLLTIIPAFAAETFIPISLPPEAYTVNKVYRCDMGMLWIGTDEGLYSYDGYAARPTFLGDKVAATRVFDVLDAADSMYVASDNGLLIFDRRTYSYKGAVAGSPRYVRALAAEGDNIFVGSLEGFYRFHPDTGIFDDLTAGLPHKAVNDISTDGDFYFIATYDGVGFIRHDAPMTETFYTDAESDRHRNISVNSIAFDSASNLLYAAIDGGLFVYELSNGNLRRMPGLDGVSVNDVEISPSGTIYAGTDNGLYVISDGRVDKIFKQKPFDASSLPDNVVNDMFCDSDGNLIVGTDYGAAILPPYNAVAVITSMGLEGSQGNVITDIFRYDDNTVWYSGNNGLLMVNDGNGSVFYRAGQSVHSLPHNNVRDVVRDSDGRVWIGTDAGVSRFDEATGEFVTFLVVDTERSRNAGSVRAIADDGHGRLWIASYMGGIMVVDKANLDGNAGDVVVADKTFDISTGMSNELSTQLVVAPSGKIYASFSGETDVVAFDPVDMAFDVIHSPDGEMTPSKIIAARASSGVDVWVGYSGGIASISADGSVVAYPFPFATTDVPIAMERIDGTIWISTVSGIIGFDVNTKRFAHLPVTHGLYYSIYYDEDADVVQLGGVDCLALVDRASVESKARRESKLYLTEVRVNGKPLQGINPLMITSLDLNHRQNYIELRFSDLDMINDLPIQYEFRLEGATDTYSLFDASTSTIRLVDLDPGNYVLLIRRPGTEQPIYELPVRISPPWYLSPLMKVIVLLVLLLLAGQTINVVLRRRRRRRMEQERSEALALARSRMDFLSSISNELKIPLSQIIGPVSSMLNENADESNQSRLSGIYSNALKLKTLIHRALDFDNDDTEAAESLSSKMPVAPTANATCTAARAVEAPSASDVGSASLAKGHPDAKAPEADSTDEALMTRISKIISENISDEHLSVAFLADKMAMSQRQLSRLVKKNAGVTPVDLIRTMRLCRAAELLDRRCFSVAEVMYMSGFNSSSYFARSFAAAYGLTPKAYSQRRSAMPKSPDGSIEEL